MTVVASLFPSFAPPHLAIFSFVIAVSPLVTFGKALLVIEYAVCMIMNIGNSMEACAVFVQRLVTFCNKQPGETERGAKVGAKRQVVQFANISLPRFARNPLARRLTCAKKHEATSKLKNMTVARQAASSFSHHLFYQEIREFFLRKCCYNMPHS